MSGAKSELVSWRPRARPCLRALRAAVMSLRLTVVPPSSGQIARHKKPGAGEDADLGHVPRVVADDHGVADVGGENRVQVEQALEVAPVRVDIAGPGHGEQQQVELLEGAGHPRQPGVRIISASRHMGQYSCSGAGQMVTVPQPWIWNRFPLDLRLDPGTTRRRFRKSCRNMSSTMTVRSCDLRMERGAGNSGTGEQRQAVQFAEHPRKRLRVIGLPYSSPSRALARSLSSRTSSRLRFATAQRAIERAESRLRSASIIGQSRLGPAM